MWLDLAAPAVLLSSDNVCTGCGSAQNSVDANSAQSTTSTA
jgi:hypothetical protein